MIKTNNKNAGQSTHNKNKEQDQEQRPTHTFNKQDKTTRHELEQEQNTPAITKNTF